MPNHKGTTFVGATRVSYTRTVDRIPHHCEFSNVVAFGHSKLWGLLQRITSLIPQKCCGLRLQRTVAAKIHELYLYDFSSVVNCRYKGLTFSLINGVTLPFHNVVTCTMHPCIYDMGLMLAMNVPLLG